MELPEDTKKEVVRRKLSILPLVLELIDQGDEDVLFIDEAMLSTG